MLADYENSMVTGPRADPGPVSPFTYKRAIVRSAPPEFSVEVLTPTKQGNHFSYGLRVCPVFRSRGSSDSGSMVSYSEYDIWRRWEDCLDFQETLEDEYEKMSREKIRVLKDQASGKKRDREPDSPYRSRAAAASFESLPEGPDPREVVMDVHKLIPTLTRKGTLFHVGRSTLKQRGDEFAAMIEALFTSSPDAPVLLQELRNCSSVRDFFAFWRRDEDLCKKAGKAVPRLRHSNRSLLSLSNFTFMSSSTTPSSPAVPVFPREDLSAAFLRHSMFTRTTADLHGEAVPPDPSSAPAGSRQFPSDAASNLTRFSTHHEHRPMAAPEADSRSMRFTDSLLLKDEQIQVVHSGPHRRALSHCHGPQSSRHLTPEIQARTSLASSSRTPNPVPEDGLNGLPRPQARQRSNSATTPGHRNARIFIPAPTSVLGIAEQSPHSSLSVDKLPMARPSSPPRQRTLQTVPVMPTSPQSSSYSCSASSIPSSTSVSRFSVTSSISSYTQPSWRTSTHSSEFSFDSKSCFDPDVPIPNSPTNPLLPLPEIVEATHKHGHKSRASASSFASFRTEASADGVLPRHLHPYVNSPRVRDSTLRLDSRTQSSIEPISEGDDLLDAYFTDFVEDTTLSMESLDRELPPLRGHNGKNSISSISSIGSANSTDNGADPRTPSSPHSDAFVVKAVYHDCVIVFRAERTMCLTTIRQRIKERFALHENVPLDESFLLGYAPSRMTSNGVGRLGRRNSVNSTVSDLSRLWMLQAETDWQNAMVTSDGKLTLRVLDP